MMVTIAIVLIINIIPILKINDIIDSQKKLNGIINSNMLTYKNISNELGPYIYETAQEDINIDGVLLFDYQFFDYSSKLNYYMINSYVQNINRNNFNENLDSIFSIASKMTYFTEIASNDCNYRIAIIIINIILITGMGVVTFLNRKNIRYYRTK